jgi:hypothetical protein
MKLDFFGSIEPDGCYFGRRRVLSIASFILFATILASVVTLILLFYIFITVLEFYTLRGAPIDYLH